MSTVPARRAASGQAPGNGRSRGAASRRRTVHRLEPLEDRLLLSRLFAIPRDSNTDISELNPSTGAEINRFPAPAPTNASIVGADGLAFDGVDLWYLSDTDDILYQLNPNTGSLLNSTALPSGSYDGLAALRTGGGLRIYAQNYTSDQILVFDPSSHTVVDTLNVEADIVGGLSGIADPNALVATDTSGNVFLLDPTTGAVQSTFTGPGSFQGGTSVVDGLIYVGPYSDITPALTVYNRAGVLQNSISLPYNVAALGGDDLSGADLAIVKTADAQVNPGGVLTYTLTVTNLGGDAAINTVVTDPLPIGTTLAGISWPGAWTATNPGIGNWGIVSFNTGSLASGATATFTISVNLNSPPLTTVNNSATVGSATYDPDPTNNISSTSTLIVSPFVNLEGNALDNQFTIRFDPNDPHYITFTTDGVTFRQLASTILAISVSGFAGNDTLTVDNADGAIAAPINYDGGPGANNLVIRGGTADSNVYAPGPGVGMGISTLVFGAVTERITFQNLAPVLDLVAGPLTVLGTPSNDTINYSAAATAGNGLVVVNNFESIEFSNKTSLTLDGVAGDDTITVNNLTIPTGLTALDVVGGLGTDTLVVDANNLLVLTTFISGSQVNIPVATPIPVTYDATVERIRIVRATTGLVGTALAIGGTEARPLVGVPVATFGFIDPASPVVLGDASAFAATIDWGDGSTSPGTIVANSGGGFSVLGTHTYAAAGVYMVTTRVDDLGSPRRFSTGIVPVTIDDNPGAAMTIVPEEVPNATIAIAPLDASGVPVKGFDGLPVGAFPPFSSPADVLVATFMDTGTIDMSALVYSATIDWGDGSPPTPATRITQSGSPQGVTFSIYGTHTYLATGAFPVTVTITKTEQQAAPTAPPAPFGPGVINSVATAASTATITDAPLLTPAQTPITTTEAALFPVPVFAPPAFSGVVAAFNDTNALSSSAVQFAATIDWGDGTPPSAGIVTAGASPGSYLVSGSHTYANSGVNGGSGTFAIQVFVTDSGGARLTIANSASVADRPIVLAGILNPSSDSGKFNNDAVTNVSRPNFYGLGAPLSLVTLLANGSVVALGQTDANGYWNLTSGALADGSYVITATATDQFGVTTAGPVTIVPNLVIDTVAPRVTYAGFDRMTGTVYYTFQDYLPDGTTPGGSGLLSQSLGDSANYSLNRVHPRPPGTYIATDISVLPGTATASNDVAVSFNGGRSQKGGYFQIVARSKSDRLALGLQDVAGNALDGEFYGQASASGNGVPGGDFVANVTSIHQAVPGSSYSGPLTIIGYPHPNDPPWKVPAIARRTPARTISAPAKKPARASLPRATAASTTNPAQWNGVRERLLRNAAAARGAN